MTVRRKRRRLTNKEDGPPGGEQGPPSPPDSLPKPKAAPPRAMGERKSDGEGEQPPGDRTPEGEKPAGERPPDSREDSKVPPAALNGAQPFGMPGGSFPNAAGDPQSGEEEKPPNSQPSSMPPGGGGQPKSSYQALGATGLAIMTATFSALVLPQAPVTPSLIGIIICYIPPFPCSPDKNDAP